MWSSHGRTAPLSVILTDDVACLSAVGPCRYNAVLLGVSDHVSFLVCYDFDISPWSDEVRLESVIRSGAPAAVPRDVVWSAAVHAALNMSCSSNCYRLVCHAWRSEREVAVTARVAG